MKILQLVTKRQFRGAEIFAAELSANLSLRGHNIIFAALYRSKGEKLHATHVKNVDLNGRNFFLNFFLFFKLLRLIYHFKPDIIQANGSDTLKYALLSKYFFPKCKIVYRNISMASTWVNNKSIKFYFIKWLIQKLDQVVSVGSAALVDFKATYQIPDAKGCVIKRGVINQSYQRPSSRLLLLKQFGFTEDEIILVHAGSFTKEKNHKFLIDCFEQIHLNEPRVRLLLVGEGPLASEIKQLVANRDIHDLVVFAGYQNHVQQIFAGADVFLLTSLTEGIPGVVLEAALQKLPVIAVNAGTINDFVINNVTGILVERHDQKLFSNAVLNLLKHKDISEQIVAGALNKVQVDHGVENSTIQFELLYNTILK